MPNLTIFLLKFGIRKSILPNYKIKFHVKISVHMQMIEQFFLWKKIKLSYKLYICTTFLSEISISKLSEQSGKRINIHPNWDISHTLQILSIRIVDVFLKSNHNSLSMCVISVHTQILWHRTFTKHIIRGGGGEHKALKKWQKMCNIKVISEIICFELTRVW